MTMSHTDLACAGCQICLSKNQQILAKDEVIRAKDAVIAAKDDAIAQKDLALKAERELREQLQKQLKIASAGAKQKSKKEKDPCQCLTKKASMVNLKSASSQAQDEKDALTIYIRNVTESVTYEMLHEAFSAFGTIRTLNVVHPKACAFVEFSTADAHQKALAATSVPVGEGHENVLTEKRVRKPQQSFSRRTSLNNLKAFAGHSSSSAAAAATATTLPHSPSSSTPHTVSTANASPLTNSTKGAEMAKVVTHVAKVNEGWLKKEDEGCDVTAAC